MSLYLVEYEEKNAFGCINEVSSVFYDVALEEPFRFGNGTWGIFMKEDKKLNAYISGRYSIRKHLGLVPKKVTCDIRQVMVYRG